MEVRWLFVYGELAGVVGWCSSVAIVTMAYIVAVGVLLLLLQQWLILLLVFQCCYCSNGLYGCWCSSFAIATMAYIVAVGVLFEQFPHYVTRITGWSFRHKSNYVWIV